MNVKLLITLLLISQQNLFAQDYKDIAHSLLINNTRGIPTEKKFDYNFITSLDKRGEAKVYTRENSNNFEYIGMPICGIGTGQLYMGGDGQLWFWDIFNHSNKIRDYKGDTAYASPYERSDLDALGVNNIFQGFAIRINDKVWNLNRDGFQDITFRGEYPMAKVNYHDERCPIEVDLKAYSPFIPLEVEHSNYPATIFHYTLTNSSSDSVEIDLAAWLENASLYKSRTLMAGTSYRNEVVEMAGAKGIRYSASNDNIDISKLYDAGDMTIMMLGDDVSTNVTYSANNPFATNDTKVAINQQNHKKVSLNSSISKKLTLKAGESQQISFLMTWYFPNCGVVGGGRRSYVDRFNNSQEVAKSILNDFDYLTQTTEKWNDVWYDSTLPYWFLDRTFVNTSILATQTCYLFEDGRFYGFEGGYQGHGTCTHVWGYEQAMARLFPDLERNLREKTDFVDRKDGGGFDSDTGKNYFRGKYNNNTAVDGQSSIIVRSYLVHKMMTDDTFLRQNYPSIKKTMEYLITTNDDNQDGILTGWQHNTLDSNWNGKIAWLSGYYQAALRACAKMSEEYGDTDFAKRCLKIAQSGRTLLEQDLFNGDYFFQLPEADGSKTVGVQNGCEYSQMLGQNQAYQVGLGEILDPEKVTMALDALWRYNFTTDVGPYRKLNPEGRWFAMPGEGGIIACTWPNGGQDALKNDKPGFASYSHECQNGYEYAATSLMMWHGEPYRALAHTRIMEDVRYDGAKRNPYCEIEWGLHYARSMASYGLFTAACGWDYDGPNGIIKFSPKIQQNNFKAPFVTAKGWGTYTQKKINESSEYTLKLEHGELNISTIHLPILCKKSNINYYINGKNIAAKGVWDKNNIIAKFNDLQINSGDILTITVGIPKP